jgi:hypothetical protein
MLVGLGYEAGLGLDVDCNDALAGSVPRAWTTGARKQSDPEGATEGWAYVFDGAKRGTLDADSAHLIVLGAREHYDRVGNAVALANAAPHTPMFYIGAWSSYRFERTGGAAFAATLPVYPETILADEVDHAFMPDSPASNIYAAHPIPDLDGDGLLEVVIAHSHSAEPEPDGLGRMAIHRGSELAPLTAYDDANVIYTDSNVANVTGRSLAAADVDGDGIVDLIHGQHESEGFSSAGRLAIRLGPLLDADPTEQPFGLDIELWSDPERGGISFGGEFAITDLNGDGILDIAVSDGTMPVGGIDRAGQAYVFFGPFQRGDALEVGQADVRIDGDVRGGSLGYLVTADHDGDGHEDLVVVQSNDLDSSGCPGEVHVFRGPLEPGEYVARRDADISYVNDVPYTALGVGIAACDLDGDGDDELVLGEYQYSTDDMPGRGRVQIIEGWDLAGGSR